MTILEIILASICVLSVGSAWWWAVRRPEFTAWMDALAKKHSNETEQAIITAYVAGHEDGQAFERLRGSRN